jgi:hypothetical protein
MDLNNLRAQLKACGAWRDCPACGHLAWSVGSEESLLQAYGRGDKQVTFGRGWPVIPVFCTNCGFVREHLISTLSKGVGGPKTDQHAESGAGDG